MTKSREKVIDDYLLKLKEINNIEKICVATFDGFFLQGHQLSKKEEEDIPAVLSKYLNEISMFTQFTSGDEFGIGFYLTSTGFMVVTALEKEAIIQVIANGRKNVGLVLKLIKELVKNYSV